MSNEFEVFPPDTSLSVMLARVSLCIHETPAEHFAGNQAHCAQVLKSAIAIVERSEAPQAYHPDDDHPVFDADLKALQEREAIEANAMPKTSMLDESVPEDSIVGLMSSIKSLSDVVKESKV